MSWSWSKKPYYFKDKYSFEERFDEVQRIKKKYPEHIPVICEKDINSAGIASCDKCKYLLKRNMTICEFIYIIRTKIKLSPEKGLFFFINGVIPAMNEMMCTIYRNHKSNDGFLYMRYTSENTFGYALFK
jgi:GABA(A) receptor-associated protein